MMETKDKTALVTGAASGMGAAAARMFAQAGYSVMLADMNGTAVEAAVQGLAASGYEADYTVCDVTDEAQVKAMVEKTVARFGKLDAAYNNAGIMPARVETADTETEAFDHVIAVNLKGVWLCMKYELLQMRRQGHGAIVNTSSIGGLVGSPGRAGYHAAKHGVLGADQMRSAGVCRQGHPGQCRMSRDNRNADGRRHDPHGEPGRVRSVAIRPGRTFRPGGRGRSSRRMALQPRSELHYGTGNSRRRRIYGHVNSN